MCRPGAGWSSLAARRAHNPKVAGSNPAPATTSSADCENPSSDRRARDEPRLCPWIPLASCSVRVLRSFMTRCRHAARLVASPNAAVSRGSPAASPSALAWPTWWQTPFPSPPGGRVGRISRWAPQGLHHPGATRYHVRPSGLVTGPPGCWPNPRYQLRPGPSALGQPGIRTVPRPKAGLCGRAQRDHAEIQLYGQGARKGPLSFSCLVRDRTCLSQDRVNVACNQSLNRLAVALAGCLESTV